MALFRIGIVGAGIIGLAVARRMTELHPEASVTVIEKENGVGFHQTGRNSGVVHAGVYYAPGSLKARLCRRGVELLRPYVEERKLPYEECGKLIVATHDGELDRLRELLRRGRENGVPELRWLEGDEVREIEPHAAGVAAIHSPTTAITDYQAVASAFADDIRATGGTIRFGSPVESITNAGRIARVRAGTETYEFDCLVLCAGVHADRVARMVGDEAEPRIVPFRGEYYRLAPGREQLVRGLVYPVPDPAYPFLGVHFTKRVHGGVDVGPNAVLALAREGYSRYSVSPRDLRDALGSSAFRALARRHWRMGARELRGSFSKKAFAAGARRYIPSVKASDLVAAPAGIRAQALDPDGSLVDDFRIHRLGPVTAVRNAPSPGATSSMAIAEFIAEEALSE